MIADKNIATTTMHDKYTKTKILLNVTFLKNEPFMSYQRFKKGGRVLKSQFLEKSVQK